MLPSDFNKRLFLFALYTVDKNFLDLLVESLIY